jgi:hypothetical protein
MQSMKRRRLQHQFALMHISAQRFASRLGTYQTPIDVGAFRFSASRCLASRLRGVDS